MAEPEQQHQEEREEEEEPRGVRRRRADVGVDALLRLLAGNRVLVREREAAGSNEELVQSLKRSGMLSRCAPVWQTPENIGPRPITGCSACCTHLA